MHKIIPLVLFVSVSLIIGNQVAFAETDVWAFYGEVGGSATDATFPGPLSSLTGVETTPGNFQIVDGVEEYQNVDNADASLARTGPILVAKCFAGIPNPTLENDFIFGPGDAVPFQCVQNQRGSQDLGLGVDQIVDLAGTLFQPLEVGTGQLVVIDLSAILGTYENFMFRISSNSDGETAWVAVSDKGPEDTPLLFPGDFTRLGLENGFFPGCSRGGGCDNNDADISFIPKKFLYYTQTDDRQDNLLQHIKADKMELVGGHGGITDNTALLVSGSHLTASWMIPLIVSAIGIGVFVVTRK